MGTLVNYATERGVALLTLTDPPVNAYTHEMFKELDACILEARFDDDVHVVVVTGHGDKYFCAGENIHMLREADESFKYYFCLHANETLLRLENTPKLVIAAINGHCVGGRPRARHGLRRAHRARRALPDRPARGGPRDPAGHGRYPAARTPVGKGRALELLVEGQNLPGGERRGPGPGPQGVGRQRRTRSSCAR